MEIQAWLKIQANVILNITNEILIPISKNSHPLFWNSLKPQPLRFGLFLDLQWDIDQNCMGKNNWDILYEVFHWCGTHAKRIYCNRAFKQEFNVHCIYETCLNVPRTTDKYNSVIQ